LVVFVEAFLASTVRVADERDVVLTFLFAVAAVSIFTGCIVVRVLTVCC
jgi:hypothetical protein